MKKTIITIAALLLVPIISSCYVVQWIPGSGHLVTEERSVSEFHTVDLRGSGNLYVTQGETQRLSVTTDDNIMPHLRTDVRNGRLVITIEPKLYHPTSLEIQVTMPKIRGFYLSGSGTIEGQNQLRSDSIDVGMSGSGYANLDLMAKEASMRLSGSGKLSLNLDVGSLVSNISGSGKSYLAGQAQSHAYTVSGSGKLRAYDLMTEETAATISGSGNCEISVSNSLDVRISGSGSIRYKGNPRIDSRISGSGSVRPVD